MTGFRGIIQRLLRGDQPSPAEIAAASPVLAPSSRPGNVALEAATIAAMQSPRDWLRTGTLTAMDRWCLGLERTWQGDQDSGTLTLTFDQGTVRFPQRQIGSFDPSDGTFLWADDNPSVTQTVRADIARVRAAARSVGAGDIDFRGPRALSHDEVVQLVGFAGRELGFDAVYRTIMQPGSLSVYMGLSAPTFTDPSGRSADATTLFPGTPSPSDRDAALDFVMRYCEAMRRTDQKYCDAVAEPGDDGPLFDQALTKKRMIYRQYWTRDDDDHVPASITCPSDDDPQTFVFVAAVRHPTDGVLVVIHRALRRSCFRVQMIGGAYQITDDLDGYGQGLML